MYLRTTQRRNKDGSLVRYYALAENVRHPEKGHVEAKVVHSFGRADRLDRAALERLVRSIRRVLDADDSTTTADATGHDRAIEIEASFELGIVHVVEQLWARVGIGEAIAERLAAEERRAPHAAALLAMTAQRLARPGSKLACHERWLERVWLPAAKDLSLDQLYRALDILAEHGDAIEQEVFWHSVDLFKLDVDLVFYDATTAWFECDEEDTRQPRVAGPDLRATEKTRALEGGAGQRSPGDHRARRDPGRHAGALVGPTGRHRRCHGRGADQGGPPPDAVG